MYVGRNSRDKDAQPNRRREANVHEDRPTDRLRMLLRGRWTSLEHPRIRRAGAAGDDVAAMVRGSVERKLSRLRTPNDGLPTSNTVVSNVSCIRRRSYSILQQVPGSTVFTAIKQAILECCIFTFSLLRTSASIDLTNQKLPLARSVTVTFISPKRFMSTSFKHPGAMQPPCLAARKLTWLGFGAGSRSEDIPS